MSTVEPLRCAICGRTIPGVTGLQELNNLQAHLEEHHERHVDLLAAAVSCVRSGKRAGGWGSSSVTRAWPGGSSRRAGLRPDLEYRRR